MFSWTSWDILEQTPMAASSAKFAMEWGETKAIKGISVGCIPLFFSKLQSSGRQTECDKRVIHVELKHCSSAKTIKCAQYYKSPVM